MSGYAKRVFEDLKKRYPWETEFLQAADEVLSSLGLILDKKPKYESAGILERLVEPERTILWHIWNRSLVKWQQH